MDAFARPRSPDAGSDASLGNTASDSMTAGNRVGGRSVDPDEMDASLSPDHQIPTWMIHARCRMQTPDDFFPSDGVGVDRARRICAECSVKVECLEYALTYRIEHGVWGGCSERERRRILRSRRVKS